MRIFLIFILGISICTSAYSTMIDFESDSLVLIEDIVFESSYEKEQFNLLLSGSENYYEAFMSINNSEGQKEVALDKQMLMYQIGLWKQIEVPLSKRKERYYKQLYTKIHDRFLKKYELENYFYQVLSDGNYNCVSACALYAMVFDALAIDYVIKESPTHVYLVLDPEGEKLIIETTDPVGGFNKFSQNFKRHFVEQLRVSKLISDQEASTTALSTLFDTYYYKSSNDLILEELVGVQYWNDGIYKMAKKEYKLAMRAFQKSYLIYPNEKVREILKGAIGMYAYHAEFDQFEDAKLIEQLARFELEPESRSLILGLFSQMNNELLIETNRVHLYDSCANYLITHISDEALSNEIGFVYNYERARILSVKGNDQKAYDFAEKAFGLKSNNSNAEALFLHTLGRRIDYGEDHKENFDLLEKGINNYPHLLQNVNFTNVYLNYNLICMSDYYQERHIGDGDYHRNKFESMYDKRKHFQVDKGLIGHAYSKLAVYYFKKGKYTEAKKVIHKGLDFAPNNSELKSRLRAVSY